jgi:hypothetical protein
MSVYSNCKRKAHLITVSQPPPLPGYQPMSFGGNNMNRGTRIEKYKRNRKKEER